MLAWELMNCARWLELSRYSSWMWASRRFSKTKATLSLAASGPPLVISAQLLAKFSPVPLA